MNRPTMIIIFLVIGLILLGLGIRGIKRYVELRMKCKIQVDGTIVSYETKRVHKKDKTKYEYYPTVEYYTLSGKQCKVTLKEQSAFRPEIGKTCSIFYDENNPDNCYIQGKVYALLKEIGSVVCGIFLISLAIRMFLKI